MTNKGLLHSTGDNTETYKGKESENVCVYIYIYMNYFARHLKLRNIVHQLYFNKKIIIICELSVVCPSTPSLSLNSIQQMEL